MKNRQNPLEQKNFFVFIATIFSLCLFITPGISNAGAKITGQYLKNSGKEIVLQLRIANPPPTSIIVLQRIPIGSGVSGSSPEYQKFKQDKGELKWLLRQPSAGQLNIRLYLKKPIQAGSVSASVRYKDPRDGTTQMITVP